jgi:ElaB/YqjD/DUF883 family membrane-anchored ribosome-binding protein
MPDQTFKREYTRDTHMSDSAVDTVASEANNLKDKTSDAMDSAAKSVERAGHSVSDRVATAADKAASALGSTAEYVRDIDSRDIMDDVTNMAKRHPAATLAAAVALGFLVGRSATRS